MVTTATLAAALIQVFEGCRLTAYRDSGGVLTIGYGHTGPEVHEGLTITQDAAQALFEKDAAPLLAMVADRPMLEAAPLVSFGYNCGAGALGKLLRGEIFIGAYGTRAGNGAVLPGLVARRKLEAQLIEASKIMPAQK